MSFSASNQHPDRESWLNDVAERLRPAFVELGAPLPERLRIAIGFPSTGRRAKAAGECWDSAASADGTFEILIRPDLGEVEGGLELPVATVLTRELIHAAVGVGSGKSARCRKVALGLGLVGPLRSVSAGPAFLALITPILEAVGPLPHARLRTERGRNGEDGAEGSAIGSQPRKQDNRHVRCVCPSCGYLVRTARKWLVQVGPPLCPCHGAMQVETAAFVVTETPDDLLKAARQTPAERVKTVPHGLL